MFSLDQLPSHSEAKSLHRNVNTLLPLNQNHRTFIVKRERILVIKPFKSTPTLAHFPGNSRIDPRWESNKLVTAGNQIG
ncbi:hypothetical protein EUGRSUZ_F02338 [Eucalyptus grandis]|uniref:Uncharacterized protein n=2 Tax=Eucalyptus grandis TaxID=71139 RepID=A0ACC3KH84_EUCGR|nr:hypothetical protein EUGRSUZ_F02338 [Eucalyptus grandis]